MSSEEPGKYKVRADPHRVMTWIDAAMGRTPYRVALMTLILLPLALLLGPRLGPRESILAGLKVGARAERDISTPRDFEYFPSAEKLEAERAAAAARILPVFDHQSDVGAILLSRIGHAFSAMEKPQASPSNSPVPTEESSEDRRQIFANLLQVDVSHETYEQLHKVNFSGDAKAAVSELVGGAMGQLIVAHRGALVPFEKGPISVRHLVGSRTGPSGEERIGDQSRIRDLQEARAELREQAKLRAGKVPRELHLAVVSLAEDLVTANLTFNQEETQTRREAAREGVQARPIKLVREQVIVSAGDAVTKEHLSMLRALEASTKGTDTVQILVGLVLFILFLVVSVFSYATRQFRRFVQRPRDLLTMSVLLVGLLGLAKFGVAGSSGIARGQDLPLVLFAMPIAGGAMLTRLLVSAEAAALFATVSGILCGVMVDQTLGMTVFFMVTGLIGASGVTQVQSRSTILRAGLSAGLTGAFLVLGYRMFREQVMSLDTLYAFFAAVGGGLLSAFVTLALLPAMEWLFDYTTDVTLLELANLNHPLLRDLILRAPGTYHHSMVVGSLSEAACEAIGANGLLARVACYYHDLGKMKNADYFAENFKPGENPHNRLKPSMSALIVRSHVKDTIELLREHGIPELVIDTATQHHGKTLIEFFYHKAQECKEPDEEIHEEDYRYPGPKPQTREAGVIMLADGVEAAARSLAEPTEDRLTGVVQRVINSKFTDGQLDHCDLTLRDLHVIAKSFLQVLRGIHHQRPSYPWQQQQHSSHTPHHTQHPQARKEETRRLDETRRETGRTRTVERPEPASEDRTARAARPTLRQQQAKNDKKTKPEVKPETKPERRTRITERHAVISALRDESIERKAAASPTPPPEPAGEGQGAGAPRPIGQSEPPEESNADIRRLGLS